MQELTINLPNNPRLRGMSHHQRSKIPLRRLGVQLCTRPLTAHAVGLGQCGNQQIECHNDIYTQVNIVAFCFALLAVVVITQN